MQCLSLLNIAVAREAEVSSPNNISALPVVVNKVSSNGRLLVCTERATCPWNRRERPEKFHVLELLRFQLSRGQLQTR